MLVTQSCPTLSTPWTGTQQAPLSMEFSRQEYQSELPFPLSRGSSRLRDRTRVSCIGRQVLYHQVTREAPVLCGWYCCYHSHFTDKETEAQSCLNPNPGPYTLLCLLKEEACPSASLNTVNINRFPDLANKMSKCPVKFAFQISNGCFCL